MTKGNHVENRSGRLPEHLNPFRNLGKRPLRGITTVVLAVAAISALVTAGIIQLINRGPDSEGSQTQDNIKLLGASQQLAVVIVDADERREIKLLDTQNMLVHDITRGQATALTAGLSPDGNTLAFVSDSPNGPVVHVVEVEGGKPISIPTSALLEAGEDADFTYLRICEWTSISWSSDNSRFLVFGCHGNESAAIVVSMGRTLKPVVLRDTRATQERPREAMWLSDHEILFSEENEATGKVSLKKIPADADGSSVLIYGQ